MSLQNPSYLDDAQRLFLCRGADTEMEALNMIGALLLKIAGSSVTPIHDYKSISYIGDTNNIDSIVYKLGGADGDVVATRTFTYLNGAAADDDLIETDTIV